MPLYIFLSLSPSYSYSIWFFFPAQTSVLCTSPHPCSCPTTDRNAVLCFFYNWASRLTKVLKLWVAQTTLCVVVVLEGLVHRQLLDDSLANNCIPDQQYGIEDFSKDCLGSRRGIRPRPGRCAFDFRVSDEQDVFLVSLMDCSDCDSSGLDSPNSSWSIARLKEYLRRKRGQVSGKKKPSFLNAIISTDIVTSNPFFFGSSFFSLFLFLFSSSPACYAPYFSSTGTQPDKYCFTFSTILFECTLRVGLHACWPLDRRILHELYFASAATSRVPPAFDRERFHHLASGSQLHAFSQGSAFLCFVVHAHSIGDAARRLQVAGA